MINYFQIIPGFYGYGTDRLVLDLHKSFLKNGVSSHIISFTGEIPHDIPFIYPLGLKNPYNPKAISGLRCMLEDILKSKSIRSCLLHAHLTPCQLFVPFALKGSGISGTFVTTEHSTRNRRRSLKKLGRIVDSKLYHRYSRIICISDGVKESLINWLPEFDCKKLVTIQNGIDIAKYSMGALRSDDTHKPVIISVGRLDKMKNYIRAIDACALLKDLDFEYIILGGGSEYNTLKQHIGKKRLENKVKLLGFQSDVPRYLSQSDIFLLPSIWEGFGLSMVEAMACGLPVVVSNVPGVREIVGNNIKCGFLVDPHDVADIAEKLRCLIISRKLRREIGRYNELYARRFSIDITAEGYHKLYKRIVEENAG